MKQDGVSLMSDEEMPVLPPRFGTLEPPFNDEELEPEPEPEPEPEL
jgi:hypothetical protein